MYMIIGNGTPDGSSGLRWDDGLTFREKVMKEINGEGSTDVDAEKQEGEEEEDGAAAQRKSKSGPLARLFRNSGLFGMRSLAAWQKQLQKVNQQIEDATEHILSSNPGSATATAAATAAAAEEAGGDGAVSGTMKGARQCAMKVFVTFENEVSQRRCLRALSIGVVPALFDRCKCFHRSVRDFDGNILAVKEAPEADAVIWVSPSWYDI